jgi:P27 family predicted phage terminase small subunit
MPARKPVELKRRTGRSPNRDAGGRRLFQPVTVLAPAVSAPPPPVPLNETGRAAWQELWERVPWLSPESDARMIARLCQLYDRHTVLLARVDQDGPIVPGHVGQPRAHPLLATLSALETEMRQLEQQCGLTPATRAALGWVEVRAASRLDEMARRRQG